MTSERAGRPDSAILDELRAFEALPDEQDAAWNRDDTWSRGYLLVALADLVASRRLVEGVALVLDKMALGDPGEMMRSMRHCLEAAVGGDWSRLTNICVERCTSERAGTRFWAVDELGVLRDPVAMPTILRLFDDSEHEVATSAFRAAEMTVQREPTLRVAVISALRDVGRRRSLLRDEADRCVHGIQCAAPALGTIAHPRLEAELARVVRDHRDGHGSDAALSAALEGLLSACLSNCDEWDGSGVPDGLPRFSTELRDASTVVVRGHMTAFKGRGVSLEPFLATLSIDDGGDVLRSGEIRYGDAEVGLGAEDAPKPPDSVRSWLYVFTK